MKQERFNLLSWLIPLILFVFFVFLFFLSAQGLPETAKKHRQWRMNRLKPSFSYLASLGIGKGDKIPVLLEEAKFYYSAIIDFYPSYADGHAMLGFIHHKLNEFNQAEASYRTSIELNPHNFWPYHNLALLLFEQQRYLETVGVLERSLEVSVPFSGDIIGSSTVYRQVLAFMPDEHSVTGRLDQGVSKAYALLAASYYELGEYQRAFVVASLAVAQHLEPAKWFLDMQSAAYIQANEQDLKEHVWKNLKSDLLENMNITLL